MSVAETVRDAADEVRAAVRAIHPFLEWFVRLGYVAKGVIYGVVGMLAAMAAVGLKGKATDQRGALEVVGDRFLGTTILITIGVGLVAYAVWRISMAVFNPERKALIKRFGYALSASAYGAIGYSAFDAADGDRVKGDEDQWAGWLLFHPLGRTLVFAAAGVFLIVGIAQLVNAYQARFKQVIKVSEMSKRELAVAVFSGRLGLAARGLVFLLVGGFLVNAAVDADPNEIGGLDEALKALAMTPQGPWLLGAAGLGLVAYGVFMFVEARFRRIASA